MMTVRLIAHTPEPEKVVAAAAKLCYSDAHITDLLDGLTEEKTAKFLTMLSDLGHASPIEHASFTFGIEGVSRTLLAQITRHRIASFSVQSQRYVRLDDFRYVVPPEIEAIPEAKEAFLASMEEDARRYLDLAHKLEEGHTARLMAEGMPEKQARAKASKQANEDARFVLPNACETKMVVTMNARSLQNFFHLRCCSRAQWEIRELAEKMFELVYPVAPHIFAKSGPACVSGPCPESIRRVAYCTGSGSSLLEEARAAGADIFITGDVKYHTALDTQLCLFDVGHHSLEEEMMRRAAIHLQHACPMLEVVFVPSASPFQPVHPRVL